MLTTEIKQKIDNARDILVGKVPTPTGQVEQITLALVYKFMNDIDEENNELGGKSKFFNSKHKQYSWKHLMDRSLSAYERVTLYGEGLEKMNVNPNLPQFFRNVFKGAFLPFRDPEVLNLFLKEIDGFKYGHNGDLGDAFEYLLQVMGTQGDAGQFLTPRHIINFIVNVVEPDINDRILDPACGTGGFLISAYQFIEKHKMDKNSNKNPGKLTLTERRKLTNNFVGYDISNDLIRLSLVNLYLHDFPDPRIVEYDTLASLDKWDDDFECIMTNPPFMTPKGGIRPHKRFSIQANRSEVLFVDYIMEHLTPNGKSGIIVPEGIIFQSANAYKSLRKMLVERNYLYAVVSLPAGVFNPYAGVKTSILFIDRVLAKKTDRIIFVRVENDGFDLGAQRRPIEENDLPIVEGIIKRWKLSIQANKVLELSEDDKTFANLISKGKIVQSIDHNLSSDRYKEIGRVIGQKWPTLKIGEICTLEYGKGLPERDRRKGPYPVLGSNGIIGYHDEFLVKGPAIIVGRKGSVGEITWVENNCYPIDTTYFINVFETIKIDLKFLYYFLKELRLGHLKDGVAVPGLNRNEAYSLKIPLPPLKVQQEIVNQLDGYQKIIDGAKQIISSYKPEIKIDPNWRILELGKIITLQRGYDLPKSLWVDGPYPIVGSNGIIGHHNVFKHNAPGVVTGRSGTIGKVHYIEQNYWPHNTSLFVLDFKENYPKFIYYQLQMLELKKLADSTTAVPSLDRKNAHRLKVHIPPLETQKQIVSKIEEELQLVAANKKLVEIYEQKIKEKINEVWGDK